MNHDDWLDRNFAWDGIPFSTLCVCGHNRGRHSSFQNFYFGCAGEDGMQDECDCSTFVELSLGIIIADLSMIEQSLR